MIFVSVGTQLPFDRLVASVNKWVGTQSPMPDVVAQVGNGQIEYANVRCVRWMDGPTYEHTLDACSLLISHAGTGSILGALERGKPVVLMPRDPTLGEHRDDHQLQTARGMAQLGHAAIAWDEADIPACIERALTAPTIGPVEHSTRPLLLAAISEFISEALDRDRRG